MKCSLSSPVLPPMAQAEWLFGSSGPQTSSASVGFLLTVLEVSMLIQVKFVVSSAHLMYDSLHSSLDPVYSCG